MTAARTLGISVRRFDGWEPREVSEHEYDEAGQLVRTIVTREPEWDDEARAWMLALAVREAAECGRCGGNLVETTDYDSWQWEPQPPVVCLRCLALHRSLKAHEKSPEAHGMIHQVHRQARPPRKKRRTRR